MIKDGVTGQMRMATTLGKPADGMLWCSGFDRQPHQVPADEIYPKTCRCKACRSACNVLYKAIAPRRADTRTVTTRAPSETDDRYVEPGRVPPGNNGIPVPLPTWGYVPPERSHRAMHYSDKVLA